MANRSMWYRAVVNEGTEDTALLHVVSTRISQSLQGASPAIATLEVSGPSSIELVRGLPIRVYQLDSANPNEDGSYNQRRFFDGVIDSRSSSGFPKSVSIQCTDMFYKLAKIMPADHRYSASGTTDGDVIKHVLDFCDINYDDDDIVDTGFVVNVRTPMIWKANQTGQEIIAEVDRVTGCATIYLPEGRAKRIKWAPYGVPYSELVGTSAEVARVRQFFRGQTGIMFYNDERDTGSILDVKSFWQVFGYSWTDSANCNHQIVGVGRADTDSVLGDDFFTGAEDFTSEIIQTPGQAAMVAKRQLEWENRIPDTIKVMGGNDHRLIAGDVIAVYDPTWGTHLINDGDPLGYRILETERDDDLITMTCVGGPKGITAGSYLDGHEEVCCGTQAEDGTCVPEDSDGPDDEPDVPDLPGYPDAPIIECDPLEDTTCLPGTDPDVPETPDVNTVFTGCVDHALTDETSLDASCLGSPPAQPCAERVAAGKNYTAGNLILNGYTCACEVRSPWRSTGISDLDYYEIDADGDVVALHINGGGVNWRYNTETDPDLQTEDTDVVYPPGSIYAFEAIVNFQQENSVFRFQLPIESGGTGLNQVSWFSEPGFEVDGCTYGWDADPAWGTALVNPCTTPRNTASGGLARNSGNYGGLPGPLDTDLLVGCLIDNSGEYARVDVYGDMGAAYAESARQLSDTVPFHYDPDEVSRYIQIGGSCFTDVEPTNAGEFGIRVSGIYFGDTSCVPNPHYREPGTDI